MDPMDIESMQRWYLLWQLVWLLQAGMTIWMLVDAYRRGVEYFWFWIIFLFQPLGAWVYMFAVKLRSDGGFNLGNWRPFQKRVSIDELRFRVENSPTQANHAALAEALVDQEHYQEAIPHLETVLRREPEYCRALYLLALCHIEQGRPAEALPHLQQIMTKDERWSNYQAWHLRIRALELSRDPQLPWASAASWSASRRPVIITTCLRSDCTRAGKARKRNACSASCWKSISTRRAHSGA